MGKAIADSVEGSVSYSPFEGDFLLRHETLTNALMLWGMSPWVDFVKDVGPTI